MSNSELLKALEERQNYVRIIDEAEKQVKAITEQIKTVMGSETELIIGQYKITWKEVIKTVADTAKMKSAGIYDEYSKQQVTRPFTVR